MSVIRTGALVGVLVALVSSMSSTAHTANLSMSTPARIMQTSSTISASALAPTDCAAIAGGLADVRVVTSGNQGNGNSLILGNQNGNSINAQGGNDCMVGGGGNDTLTGGGGTDVCIGNAGTDTFSQCETQIQ